MSTTPDRAITGLTHRRPSAASLLKENRPPSPAEKGTSEEPAATAIDETVENRQSATSPARAARVAPRRLAGGSKRTPAAGKVQIAVDVPEQTRNRARAAFRAASYFEDVATFSDFVSNAIEAEIHRLEEAHNGGLPFEPITGNLPAGRRAGR